MPILNENRTSDVRLRALNTRIAGGGKIATLQTPQVEPLPRLVYN